LVLVLSDRIVLSDQIGLTGSGSNANPRQDPLTKNDGRLISPQFQLHEEKPNLNLIIFFPTARETASSQHSPLKTCHHVHQQNRFVAVFTVGVSFLHLRYKCPWLPSDSKVRNHTVSLYFHVFVLAGSTMVLCLSPLFFNAY
jgi:hypothetical protein